MLISKGRQLNNVREDKQRVKIPGSKGKARVTRASIRQIKSPSKGDQSCRIERYVALELKITSQALLTIRSVHRGKAFSSMIHKTT